MWWWHQQHFRTQNVDTVNILGSGSIGYVTDAYRICCMVVCMYFFLVLEKNRKESDETRAKTCLLQVRAFQIFKLQNPTSSDISDSLLFIQYGLSPHD